MTNPPGPAPELNEGDMAPGFKAPGDEDVPIDLADLRGKKVVIYFYPKDDTPGCTVESCELRDAHDNIKAGEGVILGVSPDSVASHQKFKHKFNLPFTLVADEGHHIAERYGVWGPKSTFGVKHTGIRRTTFIVDREGRIAKIFRNVKPKGHAKEVQDALSRIP